MVHRVNQVEAQCLPECLKNTKTLQFEFPRNIYIFSTLPIIGTMIYSSVCSIIRNVLEFISPTKSSAFRYKMQLKTTLMQRMVLAMGRKSGDYPGYWKNFFHPAVKFLMQSKGKAEAFSEYKLAWQQ